MIALTAATLFTPGERIDQPVLLLDDDVISEFYSREHREIPSSCRVIDYEDAVIAPAFIDIHVHGASGRDVMENRPDALPHIGKFLAKHGVGSYFPTTVTASLDETIFALQRLADAIENSFKRSPEPPTSRPVGIHLEGPFISHIRRGVHPAKNLLQPSLRSFENFWEASRGHIRIVTIAPELPGALELIAAAASRGICVSLGHSDADLETTRAAVNAGARHATHLFNAMRPMTQRDPGIIGECLTNSKIAAEIIADGLHLDPTIVKLVSAAKGAQGIILVTDGTAATGMPDGRYTLGTSQFDVKDGKCLSDGKLAGSTLTMDRAIRNVMQFAGYSLQQAITLATANPARSVDLQIKGLPGKDFPRKGKLEPGSIADIAVLTPAGEMRDTIIGGKSAMLNP